MAQDQTEPSGPDLTLGIASAPLADGGKLVGRVGADQVLLIRRGEVRIMLPLSDGRSHHLVTFGRGGFFGEMAFLDRLARSADAIAFTDCDLYVLSRERFDTLVQNHKMLGLNLMEGVARMLAARLRQADVELNALEVA